MNAHAFHHASVFLNVVSVMRQFEMHFRNQHGYPEGLPP